MIAVVEVEGPAERSRACRGLLESLPEWRGRPESVDLHSAAAAERTVLAAERDGVRVGVLALRSRTTRAAEIALVAVREDARRAGAGRALVEAAEARVRAGGAELLSAPESGPRGFWEALGFAALAGAPVVVKALPRPGIAVIPVEGLPEVEACADLAALIAARADLADGDVVVVAQKAVSKVEERVVRLADVTPTAQAIELAVDADPRHVQVILDETARIVRSRPPLVIAETRHGFVCASAGVDASNAPEPGTLVLLPVDPDASAARLRDRLRELTGRTVGVIVSDSFGRPFRQGTTDVAIGVAGVEALSDLRGTIDAAGYELRSTQIAVADELAAAAELVRGKARGVPAAIVRGLAAAGDGRARDLVMPPERDLFGRGVDGSFHCSRCGSPLPSAPPVACPTCGAGHWRNAAPAAAALVVSEGKLLLVRRAHDPWRGRWCAPSGFCDVGEHPIATAEREAAEETGIAVEVTGYLGTWLSYYAEDDAAGTGAADDVAIAVAYYHARPAGAAGGRPDPAEIAEVGWFPPDALPAELAPPATLPAVLAAWREAAAAGDGVTPLRDRPVR